MSNVLERQRIEILRERRTFQMATNVKVASVISVVLYICFWYLVKLFHKQCRKTT